MLCLPEVYDEAYKTRIQEMHAVHQQLAEITDENKRRRAQMAIQGHFREWLQSTGKSRQLADLARMAQMASTQTL
jgi:alcohol dehydrogenase YqhD (iron-dependent ADH family)